MIPKLKVGVGNYVSWIPEVKLLPWDYGACQNNRFNFFSYISIFEYVKWSPFLVTMWVRQKIQHGCCKVCRLKNTFELKLSTTRDPYFHISRKTFFNFFTERLSIRNERFEIMNIYGCKEEENILMQTMMIFSRVKRLQNI